MSEASSVFADVDEEVSRKRLPTRTARRSDASDESAAAPKKRRHKSIAVTLAATTTSSTDVKAVTNRENNYNDPFGVASEVQTGKRAAKERAQLRAQIYSRRAQPLHDLRRRKQDTGGEEVELLGKTDDALAPNGSLRFPGQTRDPAKWCTVPKDASICDVAKLLLHTWQIEKPDVIISITGAATGDIPDLSDEQRAVRDAPAQRRHAFSLRHAPAYRHAPRVPPLIRPHMPDYAHPAACHVSGLQAWASRGRAKDPSMDRHRRDQ